jgi:hypothetical protein
MTQHDLRQAVDRPLSFVQTIKAVAWSFVGMRKSSGYQQDVQKLNPVHVIVAGIIGAVIFVLTVALLVQWVVSSGVAT